MTGNLKRMIEAETQLASTGSFPSTQDLPEAALYQARVIEADFQKAEAIVLASQEEIDPLQLLRTYLSSGELARAAEILFHLQSNGAEDMAIELLLESARLASFEGRWSDCEEIARQALELKPPGISQLALRQVRATALLELGYLRDALREIERAEALLRLFSHGNLPIYVAATKVRHSVRSGDLNQAERELSTIWKKLSGPTLNVDICVVLLRVETELSRALKKNTASIALAIWILCRANSDKLYAALAIKDLELDESAQANWHSLQLEANQFMRARACELRGAIAQGLKMQPSEALTLQHLLLEKREIFIDLTALKVTRVKLSTQLWDVLRTLSRTPMARADFFVRIWGLQKFNAELHDDVIRRSIYRLRRSLPIEVSVENGMLAMMTTWVVGK